MDASPFILLSLSILLLRARVKGVKNKPEGYVQGTGYLT